MTNQPNLDWKKSLFTSYDVLIGTLQATEIELNSMKLLADFIEFPSGETEVLIYFRFRKLNNSWQETQKQNISSLGLVEQTITGLDPSSVYEYYVIMENINTLDIIEEGQILTAMTFPQDEPNVYNLQITENFTGFVIKVTAEVEDRAKDNVFERGFVYSTNPNPTISSMKETVSGTVGQYSGDLTVNPNTGYYIRAYAENTFEVGYSNEIFIKTPILFEFSTVKVLADRSKTFNINLVKKSIKNKTFNFSITRAFFLNKFFYIGLVKQLTDNKTFDINLIKVFSKSKNFSININKKQVKTKTFNFNTRKNTFLEGNPINFKKDILKVTKKDFLEVKTKKDDFKQILNEAGYNLTLIKEFKELDPMGKVINITTKEYKILCIIKPSGQKNRNLEGMGEITSGELKAFFQDFYIINNEVIRVNEGDILQDQYDHKWRIEQLNEWKYLYSNVYINARLINIDLIGTQ